MNDVKCRCKGSLLKKVRKALGFRQHEIVGTEITRNLISLIENEKVALNDSTTKIVIENMNRLAEERNLGISIDERDLCIEGMFDAKQKANEYIEILRDDNNLFSIDIDSYFEEINMFLNNWDLPSEKSIIFENMGDICNRQKYLNKSFIYYIKSFENAIRLFYHNKVINVCLKVMFCCIRLGKYEEALEYAQMAEGFKDQSNEHLFTSIIYNRALAYKYLGKYDLCINEINKLLSFIGESQLSKYLDLMTLKAICFKRKEMYEDSLEIYKTIYPKTNESTLDSKLTILANMMEIHVILKDNIKVNELLDTIVPMLSKLDLESIYLCQFMIEVAAAYKFLNEHSLTKRYLIDALEHAKQVADLDSIQRIVSKLVNMYTSNEMYKWGVLDQEIIYLIANKFLKPDNESIFQLMAYYNKANLSEKIGSIIKTILDVKRG